jgi:hypothetical protein
VKFSAGGVAFSAGPDERLLPSEREALLRLDAAAPGPTAPFEIELVEEPPWTSDDPALFPQWEPAVARFVEGKLLASHRSFTAEIEPFAGTGRLQRREPRAYPLETVVRLSMMARLPLVGGLPLHAAGVVLAGRGIAFFGPSGAGKTTLAATCPATVLSDELVAVAPGRPFALVRSGFWGEARPRPQGGAAPLALLVDLAKGPAFHAERLGPARGAGRVLASVPVPHVPEIWHRTLAVVAELVSRVPVIRMAWSPASPPWAELQDWLDRLG